MIDLRFVPLTKWPGEPTKERKNAPFRSSYTKTLDLLEFELGKIDARQIVIEAFYSLDQIRNDGWPRGNQNPRDPGVILSFKKPEGPRFLKDGKWYVNIVPLSFPCDTYFYIEHNIHAIALSLAALRAVESLRGDQAIRTVRRLETDRSTDSQRIRERGRCRRVHRHTSPHCFT